MLKTRKSLVAVAATCALAFGLTACGGDSKKVEYKADETTQSQQAEKKDETKPAAEEKPAGEEKKQEETKPAASSEEAAVKQRAVEILHLMGEKKFDEVCKHGAVQGQLFKDKEAAVAGCAAGMEKTIQNDPSSSSALELMKVVSPELLDVTISGDNASVSVQGTEVLKMIKVGGDWYFTA